MCLFGQHGLGRHRRGVPESVQERPGSASGASGSAPAASKQPYSLWRNGRKQKIWFVCQIYLQKTKKNQTTTHLQALLAIWGVLISLFGQHGLGGRGRGVPERVQEHPGSASGASGIAPAASKQPYSLWRNGRKQKLWFVCQIYLQKTKTFRKTTHLPTLLAI